MSCFETQSAHILWLCTVLTRVVGYYGFRFFPYFTIYEVYLSRRRPNLCQEELAVNLVAGEPVQGPITPNYPFGPSREIAGDYVKK